MKLDLKAHRCPMAQIYANRALILFLGSDKDTLTIESIEPALKRTLLARIEKNEWPLSLKLVNERAVTTDDLTLWQDRFDEDDLEGAGMLRTYIVSKVSGI